MLLAHTLSMHSNTHFIARSKKMTAEFERIPNEPIIIGTFGNPYEPIRDAGATSEALNKALNETEGNVYYVADFLMTSFSFSDMAIGMSEAFRAPGSPYANPRLKMYIVGSAELLRLGVEAAATQQQYGSVPMQMFPSVDEALTKVRADLAQKA
jgi:hypothetical protein